MGRMSETRLLLYVNMLAASALDLAVAIALVRTGAGREPAVTAAVVVLLPLLLTPTVLLHRRVVRAAS